MQPTIKVQLKSLVHSGWLGAMLAPLIAIGVIYSFEEYGVASFGDRGRYLLLYFNVYVIILGVYLARSIRDLETTLQSRTALYLTKILSGMAFGAIGFLVPLVCFLLQEILLPVELSLVLGYLLKFALDWLVALAFLIPLGFFLGLLFSNKGAYVAAVFLSFFLSPFLTVLLEEQWSDFAGLSTGNALMRLLNLSIDNPSNLTYYFGGAELNRNMWCNLLFYLLFGGMLVLVVLCLRNPGNRKKGLCMLGSFVLLVGTGAAGYGFIRTAPTYIDVGYRTWKGADPYPEKIRPLSVKEAYTGLEIVDYSMDLSLKEALANSCSITLSNTGEESFQQNLELKLDESLKVKGVSYEGVPMAYFQEGDTLQVQGLTIAPRQQGTLQIDYEGRINYMDGLHVRLVYADNNSACLPEMFCWYPQLENGQEKIPYEVRVTSRNPVISNLRSGGDPTVLQGNTQRICLYSGYFETREVDGKPVTASVFLWRSPSSLSAIDHLVDLSEFGERKPEDLYYGVWPVTYDFIWPKEKVGQQVNRYFILPATYNDAFRAYIFDDLGILAETLFR